MGHATALRCLGQRWVKILWTMWRNHAAYDEATHTRNQGDGSWVVGLLRAQPCDDDHGGGGTLILTTPEVHDTARKNSNRRFTTSAVALVAGLLMKGRVVCRRDCAGRSDKVDARWIETQYASLMSAMRV